MLIFRKFSMTVIVLLAGTAYAQEGLVPLPGKAVEAIVAGKTLYWDDGDIEYHDASGRSAFYNADDHCFERGEWWVTEREICYRYPDLASGPYCFTWYKTSENHLVQFYPSYGDRPTLDNVDKISKILNGNVEKFSLELTTCGVS